MFFIKHPTVCVSAHFGLVVRIPPLLVLPLYGEETLPSAIAHFSRTHQPILSPIPLPPSDNQLYSMTAFVVVPLPSFRAGDAAMSSLRLQLLELVFKIAYCEAQPGHVFVGPIGPM